VTEPHDTPAGAPGPGRDLVVGRVDDPRFAILEPPEFGLRIDPDAGPSPHGPSPLSAPAVVQAPARDHVGPARRRAARLVMAGLLLPVVVAAAIAGVLVLSGGGSGQPSPSSHGTSARPPAFTISTTVTATAAAGPGIAVTPAGNGGLWYQTAGGRLTRLASADGSINYQFPTRRPALGLAVSGPALLVLDEPASGAELVSRDRGSGRITARVPLPGTPVCAPAALVGCGPAVADGTAWVALDDGVARVESSSATLTDLPGVRAVVAGGRRIWALSDSSLFRLDPASGRVLGRSSLRRLQPVALAAGAGAVWVAGSRDGRPLLLRFDGPPDRAPLAIAMPSAVRAIAATGGAIWLALTGQGVRELDPSRNQLAGSRIGLSDQDGLLATRPDQLWAVRLAARRASFTRIDLTRAR
jgi:hypothetical protein